MSVSNVIELAAMFFSISMIIWVTHIAGTASDRDLDWFGALTICAVVSWAVFAILKVVGA